ncbi:SDR family oxidoreductase [Pseudomonas sp. KNUC1026]|uniref:SDR family oxidoreductase n=1 Tax=Pseudomonas sp. KNUC1026 TaxID=2893890 RepID=UPI001F3FC8F4|nr:SDR family NAD(P)-dependent oxidoreductase [Pseudomonas sp. KNUC1026]UFH50194.1 SDR family oxidoreductase [Pseudomonas sp. KNUC1026]
MERIALITGGASGIGLAIAHALAAQGHDLILAGRSQPRLETARAELAERHPARSVEVFSCDVSEPEQVRELFGWVDTHGWTLQVLVNGAGISGGGITAQVTDELWQAVIATNLNGAFYVTREALQRDRVAAGGRIINIASTGGKQGVLHGAPYSASKHGLVGFSKSLGLELARNGSGITVNAVCPGFVESDMAARVRQHYAALWGTDEAETRQRVEQRIPTGRYVNPEEVAGMVVYLASPLAGSVTAQALNVCGGLGNY